MTAKFAVALTRETREPGSTAGAITCQIALEAPELRAQDAADLEHGLRNALSICRQAISDELAGSPRVHHDGAAPSSSARIGVSRRAGRTLFDSGLVSRKQLADIRQLAAQVTGLGAEKLEQLCQRLFHRPAEALSSLEASNLIETLKQANTKDQTIEAFLDELN